VRRWSRSGVGRLGKGEQSVEQGFERRAFGGGVVGVEFGEAFCAAGAFLYRLG